MTPGGSSSPFDRRSILSRKCSSRTETMSSSSRASSSSQSPRRLRRGALRGTCAEYPRGLPRRGAGPLLEEDLALVVDQLAIGRVTNQLNADLTEERVAENLQSLRRASARGARAPDPRCLFARSSFSVPLREKTRALMTMPPTPGGTRERAVTNVASLLAEDGAEELLLGRELGLALGSQCCRRGCRPASPRRRCGRCPLSSRSLRASSPTFGMSRGDFFFSELRVAGDALELLDVNRGEDVVLGDALGNEDRVVEVVALPGHERDEHVLAERELAHVAAGRRRGRRPASPSRRRERSASG